MLTNSQMSDEQLVEAFQAGFGPHAEEILGDIPNYTDLAPTLQISEVMVEKG